VLAPRTVRGAGRHAPSAPAATSCRVGGPTRWSSFCVARTMSTR
jgi:hypothetical protein